MSSFVYIMANGENSVLYVGVTSDLKGRVFQHKESIVSGFTKRYRVTRLVYYEVFGDIDLAIAREKQIKAGSRGKEIELIERVNPTWRDLWSDL
jgi:putative endonuclease